AVGLVLITSSLWARPLIYIGVVVATVGQVVASSFIFATVSKRAGGLGLGALQSAGAFGRIVGPVLGGFLYTNAGPAAPFATAALITLLTIPLLFRVVERVAV
ncbi:MAG: MFS transporter, partial [Pyrobaculum sp.]